MTLHFNIEEAQKGAYQDYRTAVQEAFRERKEKELTKFIKKGLGFPHKTGLFGNEIIKWRPLIALIIADRTLVTVKMIGKRKYRVTCRTYDIMLKVGMILRGSPWALSNDIKIVHAEQWFYNDSL